jgi:hypothetical protein
MNLNSFAFLCGFLAFFAVNKNGTAKHAKWARRSAKANGISIDLSARVYHYLVNETPRNENRYNPPNQ